MVHCAKSVDTPSSSSYKTERFNSLGLRASRLERGGGSLQFRFQRLVSASPESFRFLRRLNHRANDSLTPGPCDYSVRTPRTGLGGYMGQLASRNFGVCPNYTPGPGFYSAHKLWNKPSFNIKYSG